LSGWVKRALDVLGEHPQLAMLIGALLAVGWAATGGWLGRRQARMDSPPHH
ncbi:MAG TPA: MFS transporter, partial [Pseudomonas sp.]|nr:MFS transporter [Pseudomonas sp.]